MQSCKPNRALPAALILRYWPSRVALAGELDKANQGLRQTAPNEPDPFAVRVNAYELHKCTVDRHRSRASRSTPGRSNPALGEQSELNVERLVRVLLRPLRK